MSVDACHKKGAVSAFSLNECVVAPVDALNAPGRHWSMRMASIVRGKAKMPLLDDGNAIVQLYDCVSA